MKMSALFRDDGGGSAAEFALVVPLLIILFGGIIDGGRWLFELNRAEKATQVGARFAVVTNPVAPGLATADYIGVGGLTQGDSIPKSAFGVVTCGSTGCCQTGMTCTTPYPTLGTFDSTTFNAMVSRMTKMKPDITADKVRITYSGSGLGYAGDPNGMDVAPLVTVQLVNLKFRSIFLAGLSNFNMPSFSTTLTIEDGKSRASY
jgi:hypothetical protein